MKKIVFMGTPSYATCILEGLISSKFEILALFTQPDKKFGRKQIITAPHIKQFCIDKQLNFPIYQPDRIKDLDVTNVIKNLEPDFIIVAAYGKILTENILKIAPCINLHASLLPKYRGASPIQQSILNSDKYAGVTAMMMEKGLDCGEILSLRYVKLGHKTSVEELFDQLSVEASKLTIETILNFKNISKKIQIASNATYCKKIEKKDGLIEFDNAQKIYQKFKAFKFWPGIFLSSGLKIVECELIENRSSNNDGKILEITKKYIIVGCKRGSLKIYSVQPQSKKQMSVVSYLNGKKFKICDKFS